MGGDRNTVHLITADGVEDWPTMSKDEVARRLMPRAAEHLRPQHGGGRMTQARDRPKRRKRACQHRAPAHARGLPLPAYQTQDAAGLDLLAALDVQSPMTLAPGARALVPTGLIMELPLGYEAQVRPRSGLALNYGVTVLNSPGTIDSDYRGEVSVMLVNLGQAPFEIRRGERIAQLVVAPVTHAELIEVGAVADTERGDGGFGSTGKTAPNENARSRKTAPKKKSIPPPAAARKKRVQQSRAPATLICRIALTASCFRPTCRARPPIQTIAATTRSRIGRMT